MRPGVVLVRSDNPELQLQALRTALSLSLGDRPADLLITATGVGVLAPEPGGEAAHSLQAVRDLGLRIELEPGAVGSPGSQGAKFVPQPELVHRLAAAEFVQVF